MAKDRFHLPTFSPKMVGLLADEVAKTVVKRLPTILPRSKKTKSASKGKKIEKALFLDTSAIIDGRIFDLVNLGLLIGDIVVLESILLELKHIADSQDTVKRERGRNGLEFLEKLKKAKGAKLKILSENEYKNYSKDEIKEVDEKLIKVTKMNKGRIITCDYNLEKKAIIQGVVAINVNALANALKIRAVPGEALHVKVLHKGKDITQGVGYLDDGTMIVIEQASAEIGKMVDVVVSRVIQTTAGRILFAKKI
ncbi:MAG: TRAM domain-containing protein [Candidatus Levybacteria bacterium]|nr:TRAM domain-containing protein [Candidatus Levybacteria bacterium]MBI2190155.1 TRAM domain-containing protein [Candidatus Levybacteria bacterium]MBI2622659.1 TRAM domain-containing protein [Candidatus Levybacteria bacterium]MBI3070480.1 TRAM domain-containing protein [Candidatus Levybacteria bacterium]MBI3092763.1 TRAM domain-containing protein [Candidatus Levybacteria bacterium]